MLLTAEEISLQHVDLHAHVHTRTQASLAATRVPPLALVLMCTHTLVSRNSSYAQHALALTPFSCRPQGLRTRQLAVDMRSPRGCDRTSVSVPPAASLGQRLGFHTSPERLAQHLFQLNVQ